MTFVPGVQQVYEFAGKCINPLYYHGIKKAHLRRYYAI